MQNTFEKSVMMTIVYNIIIMGSLQGSDGELCTLHLPYDMFLYDT